MVEKENSIVGLQYHDRAMPLPVFYFEERTMTHAEVVFTVS